MLAIPAGILTPVKIPAQFSSPGTASGAVSNLPWEGFPAGGLDELVGSSTFVRGGALATRTAGLVSHRLIPRPNEQTSSHLLVGKVE